MLEWRSRQNFLTRFGGYFVVRKVVVVRLKKNNDGQQENKDKYFPTVKQIKSTVFAHRSHNLF